MCVWDASRSDSNRGASTGRTFGTSDLPLRAADNRRDSLARYSLDPYLTLTPCPAGGSYVHYLPRNGENPLGVVLPSGHRGH